MTTKRIPDISTLRTDAAIARRAVPSGSKPLAASEVAMLVGQPVFYVPEASVCCITSVTMDARPEHLSVAIGPRLTSRDALALDACLILLDSTGAYAGLTALVERPAEAAT